jgi:small subunit ribosomal protein S20
VAHTLSAKKRVRQSAKRRLRNRARRTAVKVEFKKLDALIAKGDAAGAAVEAKAVQKLLDRYSARGTIHTNTAARRKALVARKLAGMKKA